MEYQKVHRDIMNLDPNIRLVTICDTNGNIKFSDHKPGVVNLLSPVDSKWSLDLAVNSWKGRSKLASRIGRGRYVLAEYEKIKRITMPFGQDHLVYITTEVTADHAKIISGVQSMTKQLA